MPHTLDLEFLGRPGVIATAAIPCDGGVVLVDPGPTSCLPALTSALAAHGYALSDVRALLLTHIHLDHAGVAGTLAQAQPGLPVYVHAFGARHLAQPEKLLASATRLYGADMDRLWGAFLAVPEASLRPLAGGETVAAGGRTFRVEHTPGHAVHHVTYLDASDGMAYVGDTAGILIGAYVLAATPPPDIDLGQWRTSLSLIESMAPSSLFLTHFGVVTEPRAHLTRYRAVLERSAEHARLALLLGGDDAVLRDEWVRWLREDARLVLPEELAQAARPPRRSIRSGRDWRATGGSGSSGKGPGRSTRPWRRSRASAGGGHVGQREARRARGRLLGRVEQETQGVALGTAIGGLLALDAPHRRQHAAGGERVGHIGGRRLELQVHQPEQGERGRRRCTPRRRRRRSGRGSRPRRSAPCRPGPSR